MGGCAGVLRTEIHPSLDRVTVVGNVDSKVLVKKLAKIGKIAEAVEAPEQQKKREDNGGKDREGGDKKPAPADEKSKCKDDGKDTGDKAASKKECNKCTHQHAARGDDGDHGKAPSKAAAESVEEFDGLADAVKPSVPDHAAAAYHQHYHRAEPPTMSVPVYMPYHPAASNVTPYYYGGYYPMPPPPPVPMPMPVMALHPPQQLRPQQPSRFDVDYFNEDNAVGCLVM